MNKIRTICTRGCDQNDERSLDGSRRSNNNNSLHEQICHYFYLPLISCPPRPSRTQRPRTESWELRSVRTQTLPRLPGAAPEKLAALDTPSESRISSPLLRRKRPGILSGPSMDTWLCCRRSWGSSSWFCRWKIGFSWGSIVYFSCCMWALMTTMMMMTSLRAFSTFLGFVEASQCLWSCLVSLKNPYRNSVCIEIYVYRMCLCVIKKLKYCEELSSMLNGFAS